MLTVWSWEAERELFMERSAVEWQRGCCVRSGSRGTFPVPTIRESGTCGTQKSLNLENRWGTSPAEHHQRPILVLCVAEAAHPTQSSFYRYTMFAKGLAKVGGDQSASFLCTSMWLAPWSLKRNF